jgi:hypothetical protein
MISRDFLDYWRNGHLPVTQLPQLGEAEVLEKMREIKAHGYGRLEVLVRQGEITTINSQTTLVRSREK